MWSLSPVAPGTRACPRLEVCNKPHKEKIMIKAMSLALILAITALATVPASAGPRCQEDLGYGRTSS
jgi:hypothetical protein